MGFRWVTTVSVLIAAASGAAGGFYAGQSYEREQAAQLQAQLEDKAARATAEAAKPENEAREILSDKLRDPDSIRLRSVTRDGEVLCGWVNGKNSMGGYVGFSPFLIEGRRRVEIFPADPNEWPYVLIDEFNEKCRAQEKIKAPAL